MDQALFDLVYQAVARRDACYDGIYYTGVRTTGIVCRPSCRARTPRPDNVTFYPSLEAALQAGF
ncbi:Ada metal-binding domain-containing protein, partial [Paenibacillus forsythiae]